MEINNLSTDARKPIFIGGTGRVGVWRKVLSSKDLEVFERTAGDMLRELG